jgi:hypothetical protein
MLFVAQEGLQEDKNKDKKALIKAGVAGGAIGAGVGLGAKIGRIAHFVKPSAPDNALKTAAEQAQILKMFGQRQAANQVIAEPMRKFKFGGKYTRIGAGVGLATGVGIAAARIAAKRKAQKAAEAAG